MLKTGRRVIIVCSTMLLLSTAATAQLIRHWPLDEGSGDTTADLSPSGTTGMIFDADTGGLGPDGSVWVDDPEREFGIGDHPAVSIARDSAEVDRRAGSQKSGQVGRRDEFDRGGFSAGLYLRLDGRRFRRNVQDRFFAADFEIQLSRKDQNAIIAGIVGNTAISETK